MQRITKESYQNIYGNNIEIQLSKYMKIICEIIMQFACLLILQIIRFGGGSMNYLSFEAVASGNNILRHLLPKPCDMKISVISVGVTASGLANTPAFWCLHS